MNFLEICGIIFMGITVLNLVIGIVAMKSAAKDEEEMVVSYRTNELRVMANN